MRRDATLSPRKTRAATLEAMGQTADEIADAVGIHRATVFRWRQDATYRSTVASIGEDVQRVARTALQSGAHKAVKRLHTLMDEDDPRVALRACLAVLDRTGHGPTQRVDLTAVGHYASDKRTEDIAELVKVLDQVMGSA
jgi:electron transfer flavoprotein alpha/beta subunit